MRVFNSPSVEVQPLVFLSRWQVMKIADGSRHFIGHNMAMKTGRASTRIVKFDSVTRRGLTASGRIYELVGDSSIDAEANHLWAVICAQAEVTSIDISSEYLQQQLPSLLPMPPFVVHVRAGANSGCLSAAVPATAQSFCSRQPEELADLLFAHGVRQGYVRISDINDADLSMEFIKCITALERRLCELERDFRPESDGIGSAG